MFGNAYPRKMCFQMKKDIEISKMYTHYMPQYYGRRIVHSSIFGNKITLALICDIQSRSRLYLAQDPTCTSAFFSFFLRSPDRSVTYSAVENPRHQIYFLKIPECAVQVVATDS